MKIKLSNAIRVQVTMDQSLLKNRKKPFFDEAEEELVTVIPLLVKYKLVFGCSRASGVSCWSVQVF